MSAISLRSLTKHYGSVAAVSDVSFDVPEGSIFGVLGANGAGKTTALTLGGNPRGLPILEQTGGAPTESPAASGRVRLRQSVP